MGVDRDDPEVEHLVESEIPLMAVDLDVVGRRADLRRVGQRRRRDGSRCAISTASGTGGSRRSPARRTRKPGADRMLGYRAELQALGLESRPGYEQGGDFYTESGEACDAGAPRAAGAADRRVRGRGHDGRRRDAGGAGGRPARPGRRLRRRLRRHPARAAPQPGADDDSGRTRSGSVSPQHARSSSRSRTPRSRRRC